MTRICADCGGTLVTSATGYCNHCLPKRKWSAAAREKAAEGARRRWARDLADPAIAAKISEQGKRMRAANPSTAEIVEKQKAGRRARHWLPAGYENLNRRLRQRGMRSAERQVRIAEQVRLDAEARPAAEADRLAAMTPFERQMEAVRNGAKLSAERGISHSDLMIAARRLRDHADRVRAHAEKLEQLAEGGEHG